MLLLKQCKWKTNIKKKVYNGSNLKCEIKQTQVLCNIVKIMILIFFPIFKFVFCVCVREIDPACVCMSENFTKCNSFKPNIIWPESQSKRLSGIDRLIKNQRNGNDKKYSTCFWAIDSFWYNLKCFSGRVITKTSFNKIATRTTLSFQYHSVLHCRRSNDSIPLWSGKNVVNNHNMLFVG